MNPSGLVGCVRGLVSVGFLLFLITGCQTTRVKMAERAAAIASIGSQPIVEVTDLRTESTELFKSLVKKIRAPSERTVFMLRKYDLYRRYEQEPDQVISFLQELALSSPTIDEIHGLAELAEIQADWSRSQGNKKRATKLYATSVLHAYQFLFDPNHDSSRNAYDPQFRSICDIYNRSLEGLLRQVLKGELKSGQVIRVGTAQQGIEFQFQIEGRWSDQKFDRFEFVNDYKASGIANHYHTYGLGVPLIAVRKNQKSKLSREGYYPPELTLPMTAFMRLLPGEIENLSQLPVDPGPSFNVRRAVLSLYDPLEQTQVKTESRVVPLESDITTPLAYGLDDPLVNRGVYATASLLNAEFAPELYGMFMLEPYDPKKIPVVMVHGLWSIPVTWVHMFNDLRANPDIHQNYQFWFYSYPTGQPFWISAQQMRNDLAKVRNDFDPGGDSKSLDQMILVGHSMGGLVSLLQTVDSEDHFWNVISNVEVDQLEGDSKTIDLLRDTFYFRPNPSIERVITIATPLKGSEFANGAARWMSQKLFTLPNVVTNDFHEIARLNKGKLKSSTLLTRATSIDSLATNDPVFEAMAKARQSNRVKTHNIIGKLPQTFLQRVSNSQAGATGDGVVSIESARNPNSVSEVFVPAEHSDVHQHSSCVYEVRRILLEHLAEYNRIRPRRIPERPVQQATRLEPILDYQLGEPGSVTKR